MGTTTVTAAAADSCGSRATCEFDVTVVDSEPPTLTCPANITVDADPAGCSQVVSFAATAKDNCSVASLKYYDGATEISSPRAFYVGIYTIRAEARDPSGNISSCTFTVTVRDKTSPRITCPPRVRTSPDPGADHASDVVIGMATALDPCAVAGVSGERGDGLALADPYPLGSTLITWTARDTAGNASSCTQEVRVEEAPLWLYLPCVLRQ